MQNYAATLTDADFLGDNNHISKADLVAFYGTLQAVIGLLQANNSAHFKNLYTMKRG